ncbi:dedicator of cytokinesis protein 3-like [Centruroides sculpturatus]|uniref:dedicator of cytokinesis protein 3-like n=1 Tax=Centruroides sculpturatus TaxID=218467 RepID=UPI000C6E0091|nr:dedicator of cytokinesis protein 3-like [Centruroides sculpturatus]
MRDFSYNLGEDVEIYFSLYDAQQAEYISERFLVSIAKYGMSHFVEKVHNHSTIFMDLGNADLNRDLYIIVHIIRVGRMLNDSKKSTLHSYRRPNGCSVLSIKEILQDHNENTMIEEEKEFTVKVYMCNESDFHQLHEFIIKRQNNKYNLLSGQPNYGLVLSIRLLHGELSQIRQETPLLFKNLAITHKKGFSDVIMPGNINCFIRFILMR